MVTIPFDYDELPESQRLAIVPICIRKHDANDCEIDWRWFEAVDQVQEALRRLARHVLSDVWRVSELAEWAVLHNWRKYGRDLVRAPQRVYSTARWRAEDLRYGGERLRRGLDRSLDEADLVSDPVDYESRYSSSVDFRRLAKRLEDRGITDVKEMLLLQRAGHSWAEIAELCVQQPNTAQRRFWRWARRMVHEA